MKSKDIDKTRFHIPGVVSTHYIVSETLRLSVGINKHGCGCCGEELTIENDHAQRPFTVESSGWGSILLRDSSGNGLVVLERQLLALRRTWKVYLGEVCERRSLLYTFKHTGRKTYSVFLAANSRQEEADFTLKKERSLERSFKVHHKDTEDRPISEAIFSKEDNNLKVTIHAGVDLAFVATLVVLMDQYFNH